MGYRGSDRDYGGDRWRDRDERGSYGRDFGRDYGRSYGRGGDDRGFLERAGDELRSWFGDEEAERRREADERRWERERAMTGQRDNAYGETAGRGWGNQSGESWHRERPGAYDLGTSGFGTGFGAGSEWRGGGEETFGDGRIQGGTSGFGGYPDHGRRFDRIDPGSVGTHGAHPMSAPVGGGFGASSSTARMFAASRSGAGGIHDPHYSEWRSRQIEDLDRDYDEYRREHQSRFEREFGDWRSKRQGQRQALGRVTEHMEVLGSDGEKLGTVDKVRGDRIILTKDSEESGGVHRSIPCSWVETVEDKVTLNRSCDDARNEWRNEENSRALFERENSGSEGPHVLNRSFSGTYGGRND
ncbi:MAG TPA: DUF2171 domain-containing protein [Allosphingosinicella sp.]